jgi:hypothetical protein
MTKMKFGSVEEEVVTREEFPLEKARATLANEVIAVIGYGVQGPAQALNLRDNGFKVIVGQRKDSSSWKKAIEDGWVEGETVSRLPSLGRRADPARAGAEGIRHAGQDALLLPRLRDDLPGSHEDRGAEWGRYRVGGPEGIG